jgi:hypothetical protein
MSVAAAELRWMRTGTGGRQASTVPLRGVSGAASSLTPHAPTAFLRTARQLAREPTAHARAAKSHLGTLAGRGFGQASVSRERRQMLSSDDPKPRCDRRRLRGDLRSMEYPFRWRLNRVEAAPSPPSAIPPGTYLHQAILTSPHGSGQATVGLAASRPPTAGRFRSLWRPQPPATTWPLSPLGPAAPTARRTAAPGSSRHS